MVLVSCASKVLDTGYSLTICGTWMLWVQGAGRAGLVYESYRLWGLECFLAQHSSLKGQAAERFGRQRCKTVRPPSSLCRHRVLEPTYPGMWAGSGSWQAARRLSGMQQTRSNTVHLSDIRHEKNMVGGRSFSCKQHDMVALKHIAVASTLDKTQNPKRSKSPVSCAALLRFRRRPPREQRWVWNWGLNALQFRGWV